MALGQTQPRAGHVRLTWTLLAGGGQLVVTPLVREEPELAGLVTRTPAGPCQRVWPSPPRRVYRLGAAVPAPQRWARFPSRGDSHWDTCVSGSS